VNDQQFSNVLLGLLAAARAHYLWFHGAHHVTRGVGFEGDHKLYSKVYELYLSQYDTAAEKAIASVGERIADPIAVTAAAQQILASYPSPATLAATGIAAAGLTLTRSFLSRLEKTKADLQAGKRLTLGMDNFLSQAADDHETFVYKLGQRVKVNEAR
jgi:hypothetical protein